MESEWVLLGGTILSVSPIRMTVYEGGDVELVTRCFTLEARMGAGGLDSQAVVMDRAQGCAGDAQPPVALRLAMDADGVRFGDTPRGPALILGRGADEIWFFELPVAGLECDGRGVCQSPSGVGA